MATNTPIYGYRTAKQTTALPAYYGAASSKSQQPLFGGSFASSFLQSPLVAGSGSAAAIKPRQPQQISPQGVAKQTTGYNDGTNATQPPAANAGAGQSPPVAGGLVYDYTTDPILQSIQALSTQQREDADTSALALRKQLAIQYGDSEYAKTLGDDATAQAAADNPYSVYAQLKKQQGDAVGNLDEQYNQANLFYGGARVKGQHDLADTYGKARYDETQNEQGALGQIEHGRLAAHLAADERDRQAQQNAYLSALQIALQDASGAPAPAAASGGGAAADGPAAPLLNGSFQSSFLGAPTSAPLLSGSFQSPYLSPPSLGGGSFQSPYLSPPKPKPGKKPLQ